MRITSQMLNQSAQKAGVEIKHSLLDYINTDKKGNTLQQLLSANKTTTSEQTKEKSYKQLDALADSIASRIEELAGGGEKSVVNKLGEEDNDENRKALLAAVKDLVDDYNSTRKGLVKAQGTLNNYYAKIMKDDAVDEEELLSAVGISYKGSGLELDESKLAGASYDDIKKAFGGDSTYMYKLYNVAKHVSDNAEANLKSLSNQYNASGKNYYAASGRYDTKG